MKKFLIILFVLSIISCSNRQDNKELSKDQTSQINPEPNLEAEKQIESEDLKNSKFEDNRIMVNGSLGLLFINTYSDYELIIKNSDSTIFASFDFAYAAETEQDYYGKLESLVKKIQVYAFYPEYDIFIVQCNLNDTDYIIVTETGERKFISRAKGNYKFYTWTEFLLSDKYVSIKGTYDDSEDNALKFYASPDETSGFIQFEQTEDIFMLNAVEVKDEWIKIKRESLENDTIKPYFGWTKWTENNKLIIDFWFLF